MRISLVSAFDCIDIEEAKGLRITGVYEDGGDGVVIAFADHKKYAVLQIDTGYYGDSPHLEDGGPLDAFWARRNQARIDLELFTQEQLDEADRLNAEADKQKQMDNIAREKLLLQQLQQKYQAEDKR